MGISDVISSFQNAWYTVSGNGQPAYRTDENGSAVTKLVMAQLAQNTAQNYGLEFQPNPYIEPDKPALYA